MHHALFLLSAIAIIALVWTWIRAQMRRRYRAISQAVTRLPKSEQLQWANREGRYANPAAVPRNLPVKDMTHAERYRYDNREGEFAD